MKAWHKTVVQEKANSLILDYEGFDFYRYQLDTKPEYESLAQDYVDAIIQKIISEKNLLKDHSFFKKHFSKFTNK